jgi:hypothetical protein
MGSTSSGGGGAVAVARDSSPDQFVLYDAIDALSSNSLTDERLEEVADSLDRVDPPLMSRAILDAGKGGIG